MRRLGWSSNICTYVRFSVYHACSPSADGAFREPKNFLLLILFSTSCNVPSLPHGCTISSIVPTEPRRAVLMSNQGLKQFQWIELTTTIYRQAHLRDASSNILAQPALVPSAEGSFSSCPVAQHPSVLVHVGHNTSFDTSCGYSHLALLTWLN